MYRARLFVAAIYELVAVRGARFVPCLRVTSNQKEDETMSPTAGKMLVTQILPPISRRVEILRQTAEGQGVKDIAKRLRVSPPRVVQMKRQIGSDIRACWGDGVMADASRDPAWKQGMRASAEKRACHALRA